MNTHGLVYGFIFATFFLFYSAFHIIMNPFVIALIYIFIITPFVLARYNEIIIKKEILILLALMLGSTIITSISDFSSFFIESGTLIILFLSYCFISIYQRNFLIIFVRAMYYLAILALISWSIFYSFNLLFDIKSELSNIAIKYANNEDGRYSLIFFNYGMIGTRNYGFFGNLQYWHY